MLYKIVKYGDPVLEQVCDPVANFGTAELEKLVADMFDTMYANKGVGLAAPQIGLKQRLTVIDISAGEDKDQRMVFINPEITQKEGAQVGEEGCLSIPGFREDVTRARKALIRAQNTKGEFFQVAAEDLLARAAQHELDHLNGVLFINHLSPLKRDMIRRKIRKLQKNGEWE